VQQKGISQETWVFEKKLPSALQYPTILVAGNFYSDLACKEEEKRVKGYLNDREDINVGRTLAALHLAEQTNCKASYPGHCFTLSVCTAVAILTCNKTHLSVRKVVALLT